MTVGHFLLQGVIVTPAAPATGDGSLHELRLDAAVDGKPDIWSVLLATPDVASEVGYLGAGEAVAFAGFANRPRFPDDPLARRFTAERALALRDRRAPTPAAFGSLRAKDAYCDMLDRVERLAMVVGVAGERLRITTIMNSPNAFGRLATAWRLAEAGLSAEAALEGLLAAKLQPVMPALEGLLAAKLQPVMPALEGLLAAKLQPVMPALEGLLAAKLQPVMPALEGLLAAKLQPVMPAVDGGAALRH